MGLLDDKVKKQLGDIFKKLTRKVEIVYFTQEFECGVCKDNRAFLEEISGLSDKLGFQTHDFVKDREKCDEYKIDKIPATALLDPEGKDTGVRFFGIPGGYEINSFIQGIFETSGTRQPLPAAVSEKIAAITRDVHIQVLVSLT
ncbi:MAG TPA: hypothetical protein ENN21_10715 [Spirochaetes bacterium]|mgnify:CR=1 FL=1|nr:hypothetical protein [Spirochaetota bacterium]